MKMQIGRWGNSLAVRLPKSLVDRFALGEGDELDSAVLEQALSARDEEESRRRRKAALRDIAATRWTLPKDWKFDRDDANAR